MQGPRNEGKTQTLDLDGTSVVNTVSMVLDPNGIEPIFLKLDSWSPGVFYSYYNLQCIKLDKGKKNSRKKSVICIQKTFNAVFKNGFNTV